MGCTESASDEQRLRRKLGNHKGGAKSAFQDAHSPPRDIDRIYGAGFNSPHPSTRCSPRPAVTQARNNRKHPTEVFEVALQLHSILELPREAREEMLGQFARLLRIARISPAEFWASVPDEQRATVEEGVDPLLCLLRQLLPRGHGRVTLAQVEDLIFDASSASEPVQVEEGCIIEGTAAAEHFVISGGGGAVVTGGAGCDVFMFMPSPDASPEKPHTLTDFDPEEDILDLRALPIKGLEDLSIDPHHHWHCRVRAPHLDVILIGVTVRQLEPRHFVLPARSAQGLSPPRAPFPEDVPPVVQSLASPGSGRAPIIVEAGGCMPGSPRAETYLIDGAGTTLISGPDPDVFVFLPRAGGTAAQPHTIQQFKAAKHDKMDLRGLGIASFEDLSISDGPGKAAIVCTRGGGELFVRLPGVRSGDLTAENFVFSSSAAQDAVPGGPELRPKALPLLMAWLGAHLAQQSPQLSRDARDTGKALSTDTITSEAISVSPPPRGDSSDGAASPPPADDAAADGWLQRLRRSNGARRAISRISGVFRAGMERSFTASYEGVTVEVDPRAIIRGRPRSIRTPALRRGNLLPPKDATKGRFTVVLDLDETLVYSRHIHTSQQLCIRYGVHDLFVLFRQFNCEVVMWSAADAETVNAIWAAVDPTGVTSHVLPREIWQDGPHNVGKDLRRLGRDLDTVLMIDNTPLAVEGWTSNSIVVRDFLGGAHAADNREELYHLAALMRQLFVSGTPVPEFLASCAELAVCRLFRKSVSVDFNVLHHRPI
eukprot:TRINITY_DN4876_c0_g1_i1.p1 TRINITY_DN4876_c0_g1~~TRINITY_DN4876_c0_g1_i1.p1  ORF type:complete len:770 (+),score=228.69 TRINITY_DN4876_c0_g1_i1:94-2403(+)